MIHWRDELNKLIIGLIVAIFVVFGVGIYMNNQTKQQAAALQAKIQASKAAQQENELRKQYESQLQQRAELSRESRDYIAAKEKKELEQQEAKNTAEQNAASIEQMDVIYKEWRDVERVAVQLMTAT